MEASVVVYWLLLYIVASHYLCCMATLIRRLWAEGLMSSLTNVHVEKKHLTKFSRECIHCLTTVLKCLCCYCSSTHYCTGNTISILPEIDTWIGYSYTAHLSKCPGCSAKDMQKFSSVQRYCGINFSNPEFQTVMHQGRLFSSATARKMNRIPQIVTSVLMCVEWISSHANICSNTDVLCVLIPHCVMS